MKIAALLAAAALFAPVAANATPIAYQYLPPALKFSPAQPYVNPLSSFKATYNSATKTFTFDEVYTSLGTVYIAFDGLETARGYHAADNTRNFFKIVKNITNNTGVTISSLANELLDPNPNTDGKNTGNDKIDVLPYPGFVPVGFSTSNDTDNLSFAQNMPGVPRTSNVFTKTLVDELTDRRDFIDFFAGTGIVDGGKGFVSYGIRDRLPFQNEPFLLVQRTNSASVPAPATLGLFGLGMLAFAGARRRV